MFAVALGAGAELRPLEPWQAEEFLAHLDRAREALDPWVPWASLNTDLASAEATLTRYADLAVRDAGRIYGVWLDGTLVGGAVFVSFDTKTGTCEAGCWLEPAGQGRGIITRAIRVLIDWAVRQRGMHRVEWRCRPDNVKSSNVARRLGLRLDGVLRSAYPYRGVRHDVEVWAITAPEWLAGTAGTVGPTGTTGTAATAAAGTAGVSAS